MALFPLFLAARIETLLTQTKSIPDRSRTPDTCLDFVSIPAAKILTPSLPQVKPGNHPAMATQYGRCRTLPKPLDSAVLAE